MLTLVMLLWAGNSIAARAVHSEIPPFTLAFCRWSGALMVLLPFAWPKIVADQPAILRNWGKILLLGAVGVGCFNAFLYSGLRYTTATNGLLIQAAIPALVLLFDFALFRVRPRVFQIIGVLIASAGVVVIVFRGNPAALATLSFGRGDALVLCGVVAWSLYTALLRIRPVIDPLSFLALTFLVGVIAMLPFALHEWQTEAVILTHKSIGGIAYVAILPSVVAYFLYNMAVGEIGAGMAGQTISLQPLFGALLAVPLLGEALQGYHVAGMLLILVGIAVPIAVPSIKRGEAD
ncbi:permease [Sphingobium chungbukense]|uniref:Permease n=2 Tax=Sphingobium chungbukense TaxID=56193 RepID=A0A0M3APD2_9SPHN|nr:permease [Sphingobium chungbukense]